MLLQFGRKGTTLVLIIDFQLIVIIFAIRIYKPQHMLPSGYIYFLSSFVTVKEG